MRGGLDRRYGMLVSKLYKAIAFEQRAEEVECRDPALQHHTIDQEHGDLHLRIANPAEKHVLQQPNLAIACLARELGGIEWLARHDGRDRMLVHQLRLSVPTQQDRDRKSVV